MGVLDTLNAATANRTTVYVVTDGALQAEWDRLNADLYDAAAKDEREASLGNPHPNAGPIADAMDALRDRMAASRVGFLLQAMQYEAQLALAAEHPPRKGNFIDGLRGFNVATFYPVIIRRCTVSVTGSDGDEQPGTAIPDETWLHLIGDGETHPGSLSSGAMQQLSHAALKVNEASDVVPPSARSLLESQESGTSSESLSPGRSASSDSEDGNPPGSPTSTDTPPTPMPPVTTESSSDGSDAT